MRTNVIEKMKKIIDHDYDDDHKKKYYEKCSQI